MTMTSPTAFLSGEAQGVLAAFRLAGVAVNLAQSMNHLDVKPTWRKSEEERGTGNTAIVLCLPMKYHFSLNEKCV